MKDVVIAALLPFFKENYPERLDGLADSNWADAFLLEQLQVLAPTIAELESQFVPDWEIVEQCLLTLSVHHGPSRYYYVAEVLEADFLELYMDFERAGVLHMEIMSLTERCHTDFEYFNFRENEDSRMLRYAIIEQVQSYCEEGEAIAANLVDNGLQ